MTTLSVSQFITPLRGSLAVPADKSISHRAAMVAALANAETRIENFLPSTTTHATLDCLRALGVEIAQINSTTLIVHGRGLHSLREPSDVLFCQGSGTTMRLLAGLCAGQNFFSMLDGTPALKRRPMARIIEPLRQMGATILARAQDQVPPLAIRGAAQLRGIDYTLPVASAQVKSAILLAGLFADSPTTICEPSLSRDHTERMLQACGVPLQTTNGQVQINPPVEFRVPDARFQIPNDFSSAAFFIVAALLVPRSELRLANVGLNPTRTGLLAVLTQMGARIHVENAQVINGEPVGDLIVTACDTLRGVEIGGGLVPRMIDEFPILAIAATQAHGETRVRDARELRVKESDRIATLTRELRALGAHIEECEDGFVIAGPTPLSGTCVCAHHDHRLAMSLAIAGLIARGETIIEGWECVADSFPTFAETLEQVR